VSCTRHATVISYAVDFMLLRHLIVTTEGNVANASGQ
jgi:hypothetical protein